MSSKDLKYFWSLSWGARGGAARASHADMSYVALRTIREACDYTAAIGKERSAPARIQDSQSGLLWPCAAVRERIRFHRLDLGLLRKR
jgi:hypothetical protein